MTQIAGGLGVLVAALGVGLVPSLVSPLAAVLVCCLGLLTLSIVALRRGLRARETTEPAPATHLPSPEAAPSGLRLARGLFFAGCLLVGQLSLRYVAGLTVSEAMFIAAVGVCAFAGVRGRPIASLPMPMIAAVAIFVVGGAISSLDAQSPPSSAFQLFHAIYVFLLWPWAGAMVLSNRRHVAIALTLWSVSAAIDGAAAVAQLSGVHVLGLASPGNRMTGFTMHPNDLGGVTAVALVPALMVATRRAAGRSGLIGTLAWVPVALTAIGLALSGSVSAMAAGAVAILVWLSWPAVRAPARLSIAAAVVAALVVVMAAGARVNSPIQRLAQVANATSQNGGSVQDRVAIAVQAWPRIVKDPFVGTGLDAADSGVTILSHGYTAGYQIHGLPLAVSYQAGVVGMLGLMALIVVLGSLGWTALRAGTTEDDALVGLALLGAFVAFVIFAMTQPMVFAPYEWIIGVFTLAWWNLVTEPETTASLAPIRPGGKRSRAQVGLSRVMRAS
jgi:O-antigen ligase